MKKVSNGVYTHEGIRVVKNSKGMYVASVHVAGEAFPRVINATTQKAFVAIYDSIKAEEQQQEVIALDLIENAIDDSYTDELMRSINMFAELVSNDYNGATHCKTRMGELVDELLAEGYESTEPIKQGDTVITNKFGQYHNVGKVYELTFDNSYIVTFGGIYIAQCYDREELIKIGNAN